VIFGAATKGQCDDAFVAMTHRNVRELIVKFDPFFNGQIERLVYLAKRDSSQWYIRAASSW